MSGNVKESEIQSQIERWKSSRDEFLALYRACPSIQERRYNLLILQAEAVLSSLMVMQELMEQAEAAEFPLCREA